MIKVKEGNGTIQHKIMLSPDSIHDFVKAASKCDFDVDIAYNRYVVDAKSIVGVFGLDLRSVLTVVCHGYDSEFENFLKELAIAG